NGNGAKLTPEQEQRVKEYPEKFGCYNIHSNNCEMFAWYVITGRRYSGQTQVNYHTKIGASVISLVQPVLTVRKPLNRLLRFKSNGVNTNNKLCPFSFKGT
ncbi:MAG: hypothetical protein ACLFT9_21535, partial [Coleofasciculus sp.]